VLRFINTARIVKTARKAHATNGSGGVAAGGGRPSTSFALPGYPRCKENGGHSEADARRAGSPHGEPRTGVPPPRRRSRTLSVRAQVGGLWVVGRGHTFPSVGGDPGPSSRGEPGMSPESACTLQGFFPAVPYGAKIHRWLVSVVAKQENGEMRPVSPVRAASYTECSTWNIPGGRSR
jgi:hypothetical protein